MDGSRSVSLYAIPWSTEQQHPGPKTGNAGNAIYHVHHPAAVAVSYTSQKIIHSRIFNTVLLLASKLDS
jgi:hypothetical protein